MDDRAVAASGLGAWLLLAVALRLVFARPFAPDLWLDEAITALAATAPSPAALARHVATQDLHPPLLAAWCALVGPAPLGLLRLPSLLASLSLVPALHGAARAAGGRGELAALGAATCTPLVLYAGELRPYALGAAAVAWALRASWERRPGALALALVFGAASQWSAWPVLLGVVLAKPPPPGERAPVALAALAVLPLLALLPDQQAHQGAGLARGALAMAFPAADPFAWSLGVIRLPGWWLLGSAGRLALGVGALAWIALAWAVRRVPPRLAAALLVPLGAFALLATAGLHPLGPTRHALVLLPPALVVLDVAGADLGRAGRRALSGALGAVALTGLVLHPGLPRPPWREAAAVAAPPVLADAAAVPPLRWHAPHGEILPLPWRDDDALDLAIGPALTREPRTLVTTDRRDSRHLRDALQARGWRLRRAHGLRGITVWTLEPPQAP